MPTKIITKVVISADMKRRKRELKEQFPSFHNWKEKDSGLTRPQAQKKKKELAQKHGYEAHPGGRKSKGASKGAHVLGTFDCKQTPKKPTLKKR